MGGHAVSIHFVLIDAIITSEFRSKITGFPPCVVLFNITVFNTVFPRYFALCGFIASRVEKYSFKYMYIPTYIYGFVNKKSYFRNGRRGGRDFRISRPTLIARNH